MSQHVDKPFVVVRFHSTADDDNEYFEVSLAQWLVGGVNDNMNGDMYWPPPNKPATPFIKAQAGYDPCWQKYKVEVMRYYDTFLRARAAVPHFISDSKYETEVEAAGPKKRRRIIPPNRFESSSEDEVPVKITAKVTIPAPPPILTDSSKKVSRPATQSGSKTIIKPRKGQGPTLNECKKKEKEELKQRLKVARAAAANKVNHPLCSQSKSPWKVTPQKTNISSQCQRGPSQVKPKTKFCDISSFEENEDDNFEVNFTGDDMAAGHFLDLSLHEGASSVMGDSVTPRKSPSPQPTSLSTFTSCRTLSRSEAFCLSPAEAQAVSASVLNFKSPAKATSKSPVKSLGQSSATFPAVASLMTSVKSSKYLAGNSRLDKEALVQRRTDLSSPFSGSLVESPFMDNNRPNEASTCGMASNLSSRRSEVDGRRRLFNSEEPKTLEERLHSIESSILSLEVLARETSSKSDVILMNVGRLQRSLQPSEKRICRPPGMPNLPLRNRADLSQFEAFLELSDANLASVCDYMSSFVKTTVVDPERKSANNLMSKLMYNNLAMLMNLDGGNFKIGFRGLNLYKVFLGTLQEAFPQSDLVTAEDALKKWLKDAKWRKQMPFRSPSGKSSRGNPPPRPPKGGKGVPSAG